MLEIKGKNLFNALFSVLISKKLNNRGVTSSRNVNSYTLETQ